MRRPQLWQLLRQRRCLLLLLLPLLLVVCCFLFFFFIFFSFLLLFLSNTAENVVILRSLRFVSFLIYSMAASMWVHPLCVCVCATRSHTCHSVQQQHGQRSWGILKQRRSHWSRRRSWVDQVTFLLTLLQLRRKAGIKKKWNKKSFLARKIKTKSTKRQKRKWKRKQNEAKLKLLLNWSLWSWVTGNSTRPRRKKRCQKCRPKFPQQSLATNNATTITWELLTMI